MRAVAIKCPNCGADVHTDAGSDTATCAYCGTVAYVQQRSRVLQIPLPIPPQHKQMPVAMRRRTLGVVGCIAGLGILAGFVVPVVLVTTGGHSCASRALDMLHQHQWSGVNGVILADIDGDGIEDAIGRTRTLQPDRIYVGAYSGADGHRLWQTQALGSYTDYFSTASGLVGQTALLGGTPGELIAVSTNDGTIRWKIRLSEKVKRICTAADATTALVETADERMQEIVVADGTVKGQASGSCQPLPNDATNADAPDRVLYAWHNDNRDQAPRHLQGIDADEAIHHPQSDVTIAVGHREKGTRVPMIASYRPGDSAPLWVATVPAGDPLVVEADEPDTQAVAVDGDGVVVAYETKKSRHYRLTLFGTDGKRRWDIAVAGDRPLSAVRMSPTHVFVSRWSHLLVYDRATGNQAWTVP